MLILTRRIGETVMIGDNISITVLGVKGNQIRLGIDAPRDVSVHREEVYHKVQSDKVAKKATLSAQPDTSRKPIISLVRGG